MNRSPMLGIGSVSMWGLTPSMDLLQFIETRSNENEDKQIYNILLVGQCDARHIINTLAKRAQGETIKETEQPHFSNIHLNFYIVENSLELYARQMLLLAMACHSTKLLGVHEKCIQFMELYGNILVRHQTKNTLQGLAEQFIKMVSDEDYLESKFPLVDLRAMKFLERDKLVNIMKYWLNCSDPKKTNMESKWDARLRTYLGTRYDSRLNIFDWDYNMKLVEKDDKANIISCKEYKNWRNTGNAFTEIDCCYSQPNVTLNSAIKNEYTYCADTITGPFVAYGIRSDENSLFEKANDKYRNRSFDVTYTNLQNLFEALRPSSPTSMKTNGFANATVHFLPIDSCNSLCKKTKYLEYFDLLYIAASTANNLTPEVVKTLNPKAKIIVEKTRYSLEFRKEHEETFEDKITELVSKTGLQPCKFLDEELSRNYFQFRKEITALDPDSVSPGLYKEKQGDAISDSDSSEVTSDWETLTDSFKSKENGENSCKGDGDCLGKRLENIDTSTS